MRLVALRTFAVWSILVAVLQVLGEILGLRMEKEKLYCGIGCENYRGEGVQPPDHHNWVIGPTCVVPPPLPSRVRLIGNSI
jgi:hypothetical protein